MSAATHEYAQIRCPSCPAAKAEALKMALSDAPKYARFSVDGVESPPVLAVTVSNNALTLAAEDTKGARKEISVSLTKLRRIIKDYRLICETYNEAIAISDTRRVETIDMGRRAFHNDGAEWLQDKIGDVIKGDDESFRYLFTLVNILYL